MFQECLGDNDAVRKKMQKKNEATHVLQDLLGRFEQGRADSLITFHTAFSVVVQALENLSSGGLQGRELPMLNETV